MTTMKAAHVKVDGQGRILIPAELRHVLGIREGSTITLLMEDGVLTLLTTKQAVRRVQEEVAKYTTPGRSLADELLAERRAEAERETRE